MRKKKKKNGKISALAVSGMLMTTMLAFLVLGGIGHAGDTTGWTQSATNVILTTQTNSVGIGTSTPSEKLEVVGTIKMTGFKMNTNPHVGYVLTSDQYGAGTWQPIPQGIDGSGTGNYLPKFSDEETISNSIIYESSGKIGIGTTNPQNILEVHGDIWFNSSLITFGDGTFYNKVQKDAKLSTDNFRIIIDENDDQTDRYFSIEKDEGKNDAQGSGIELMRCQENGNVGIATAIPTEKLDVNGKVRVRDLPSGGSLDNVVVADATGVLHLRDESTIGIQDLWETVNSDSGSAIANSPTDTLNIYGIGIVSTSISGNTLTITATESQTLSQVLAQGNSAGSYSINMNGQRIENLGDPNSGDDAMDRDYADDRYIFKEESDVWNDDSHEHTLRFEGDDEDYLLYLDAIDDRVGIGTGTIGSGEKLRVGGGNVRIGEINDDDGGFGEYGRRLYFSGGGDGNTWNSENSDYLWIARYNVGNDNTELRINIGDNCQASTPIYDKLNIGTTSDSTFYSHMVVSTQGRVGIGTTTPTSTLHVIGKATITGGVDPPYVSFDDESHESIREFAQDVGEDEEVMLFWNGDEERMEIYIIDDDEFYPLAGED